MEIPLQAQVECTDGIFGRSAYVLINPVIDKVTHLVVREDASSTEYIVPVDCVAETIADTIQLRFCKADLEKMDPFVKTTFIEEKMPNRNYSARCRKLLIGGQRLERINVNYSPFEKLWRCAIL